MGMSMLKAVHAGRNHGFGEQPKERLAANIDKADSVHWCWVRRAEAAYCKSRPPGLAEETLVRRNAHRSQAGKIPTDDLETVD